LVGDLIEQEGARALNFEKKWTDLLEDVDRDMAGGRLAESAKRHERFQRYAQNPVTKMTNNFFLASVQKQYGTFQRRRRYRPLILH